MPAATVFVLTVFTVTAIRLSLVSVSRSAADAPPFCILQMLGLLPLIVHECHQLLHAQSLLEPIQCEPPRVLPYPDSHCTVCEQHLELH